MVSDIINQSIKTLYKKPGHEKVRLVLCDLLRRVFSATNDEIALEDRLINARGRIDALWGRTIFEVKRNLDQELEDAKTQIKRYIQFKEEENNHEKYIGIATDGKRYITYQILNNKLQQIHEFYLNKEKPKDFIIWLESVVLIKDELKATSENLCKQIGHKSPLCEGSLQKIKALWEKAKNKAEIRLKYNLWKESIERVYKKVGDNEESLFIEHTYLTIISKSIAHLAFFNDLPSGKNLLNGKKFRDSDVLRVVEDDFFSWIALDTTGIELIKDIASHVKQFNFSEIKVDLLKDLYEGLIDPEKRHQGGEYYTPDWLAEKICKEVITDPLNQRVIDPACGSGTFLFHTIKLIISESKRKNKSSKKIIKLICEKVAGIDIHPVAVIFSRITYLLAMIEEMKDDRPTISIPVYLGDALQWHKFEDREYNNEFHILVPEDKQIKAKKRKLIFPRSICQDSNLFKIVLDKMIRLSEEAQQETNFEAWLRRENIVQDSECEKLSRTYNDLKELHQEGRNHIWGFVASNLTSPVWLSSERQKADIVIGNPPWLKFNSMNQNMQKTFKEECKNFNLLDKKKNNQRFQTSQDLSTYFFIRCIDLYMKEKGKIIFVMPYGVMIGNHHKNFREGIFKKNSDKPIKIKFENAWVFDYKVKNLFKIPSCVLFSIKRKEHEKVIISERDILYFSGTLPKKNITFEEAKKYLREEKRKWPLNKYTDPSNYSYYYDEFKQGATLVPRRLIVVEKISKGKLGGSRFTPMVKGITSNFDKHPWNSIPPIKTKIEKKFLKKIYKGESIASFRTLKENMAIIPYNKTVIDSNKAGQEGYTLLSSYLKEVEKLWKEHSTGNEMIKTFKEQIDYRGKLTNQFPISSLRVVYTASGSNIAATLLKNSKAIIDSSLYWNKCSHEDEGMYLVGILNSSYLIDKIRSLQSTGLYGERHFHKHLLKPPIPKWNPNDPLHKSIVKLAKEIEKLAHQVQLDDSWNFKKSRGKIREEIQNTEAWNQLNQKVEQLLTLDEKASIKEGELHKKHIQRIGEKELEKERKVLKSTN